MVEAEELDFIVNSLLSATRGSNEL